NAVESCPSFFHHPPAMTPANEVSMQYLVTLPPRMAAEFETLEGRRRSQWFAASDPAGKPLGSGGGTAHLLAQAWRSMPLGESFRRWIGESRKLILHGGGLSRRLAAYAATGKLLRQVPVFRWAHRRLVERHPLDLRLPDGR